MAFGHAGELAALGAALCFTVTALAFESAGRRVGSIPVNLIRLVFALAILTLVQTLRGHPPYPLHAAPAAWRWLLASGLVGFAFGDLCLFRAFVMIGSRLAVLVQALVPALASVLSYFVTGETLGARDLLGMSLTVGGIAWVVLERHDSSATSTRPSALGILLAFGGAVGQATGLVLSKRGLEFCEPFPANQIRITAGILGVAAFLTATRRWKNLAAALRDPSAMKRLLVGATFGPFLGVSLSLFAVHATKAGVAAALIALTPVMILPAVVARGRDRITLRGAAGAAFAVAGAVILFL